MDPLVAKRDYLKSDSLKQRTSGSAAMQRARKRKLRKFSPEPESARRSRSMATVKEEVNVCQDVAIKKCGTRLKKLVVASPTHDLENEVWLTSMHLLSIDAFIVEASLCFTGCRKQLLFVSWW